VLGRKPGTNVFRPRSEEHPEDQTFPGLLLLRPEGPVFFANVSRLMDKIRQLAEEAKPRVMALDLGGVPDIEYTGLKMLAEAEQRARERGMSVWLVGLNPEVLSVIQRSSLGKLLGRERMHFSLELAVERYLAFAGPAEAAVREEQGSEHR
jgi:anti-anti-sigma factor